MRDIFQNERICADYVFPSIDPKSGLPTGMVVHHINHIRDDNRPVNLMLLDVRIHDAISPCMTHKGKEERFASGSAIPLAPQDDEEERRAIQEEHFPGSNETFMPWDNFYGNITSIDRPIPLAVLKRQANAVAMA